MSRPVEKLLSDDVRVALYKLTEVILLARCDFQRSELRDDRDAVARFNLNMPQIEPIRQVRFVL